MPQSPLPRVMAGFRPLRRVTPSVKFVIRAFRPSFFESGVAEPRVRERRTPSAGPLVTGCDGCGGDCEANTDGDGVCDVDEVVGCLAPLACNFNAFATDSDPDLCVYPFTPCETCSGATDGSGVVLANDDDLDGVCNAGLCCDVHTESGDNVCSAILGRCYYG